MTRETLNISLKNYRTHVTHLGSRMVSHALDASLRRESTDMVQATFMTLSSTFILGALQTASHVTSPYSRR